MKKKLQVIGVLSFLFLQIHSAEEPSTLYIRVQGQIREDEENLIEAVQKYIGTDRDGRLLSHGEIERKFHLERVIEKVVEGTFKIPEDMAAFNASIENDVDLKERAKGSLFVTVRETILVLSDHSRSEKAAFRARSLHARRVERRLWKCAIL